MSETPAALTHDQLIAALGVLPSGLPLHLSGPGVFSGSHLADPHSYRGYYECLAFEQTAGVKSVGDNLAVIESALCETYEGWKGGDFYMSGSQDVYLADEGCSSGLYVTGVHATDLNVVLVFSTEYGDDA